MVDKPEFLITMTGALVLAGSFAAFPIGAPDVPPSVLRKADRLTLPARSHERVPVGDVEAPRGPQGLVVLRGRDGTVLFRNDPDAGTTTVSRDIEMPVVAPPPAPVAQKPAAREADENAPERKERRARPVGCEAAVSPLVKPQAANAPSRCLAAIATPRAA